MMLGKIGRTMRHEGLSGLWVRLRHPRKSGGCGALTPPQRPPFRLAGADPALAEALVGALCRLLGSAALSGSGATTTIHIAPASGQAGIAPGDVLLFLEPEAAEQFLAGRSGRMAAAAAAVLLPSAGCLALFRRAGVGEGRLFVLPALAHRPGGEKEERRNRITSSATGRAADPIPDLAADLARWLVAAGALAPEGLDPSLFPALRNLSPQDRLCLGMPESPARRAGFLDQGLNEFRVFDGLRLKPGWQGAGWSHATIARAALAQDAVPLLVCEDDMRPEPGFRAGLATVEAYLAGTEWDLFSGLLTDVPEDCRIHHVEQRDGLTFIHLDYATGMVLNFYNRRALERLAAWTPRNGRPETDTVDAWLSRLPGMRAVTTLPFLAGHDATAVSTVFGFANRRYDTLIQASERRLARLAAVWSTGG